MDNQKFPIIVKGCNGSLTIQLEDFFAKKMAMLIEGINSKMTAKELAKKYGYTREHYYHIKRQFKKHGSEALYNKKRGPRNNSIRTDVVNNQIIRFRFLDPDMSPAVIGQKLRQMGYDVSDRSVSRTIQEYGLQKKTLQVKSSR
jgi:transposase